MRQLFEVLRPYLEGLALLLDVVMNVVRGFDAFTGVVQDSLGDIDLDTESRKSGAAGAA